MIKKISNHFYSFLRKTSAKGYKKIDVFDESTFFDDESMFLRDENFCFYRAVVIFFSDMNTKLYFCEIF